MDPLVLNIDGIPQILIDVFMPILQHPKFKAHLTSDTGVFVDETLEYTR